MKTIIVSASILVLTAMLGCSEDETGSPDADGFTEARERMVERQLEGRDIDDPKVLEAMKKVPRHEFMPENLRARAYTDRPLPIGHGQTISQPYVVAFMTQQLDPEPTDRVLEIGTGSGYQAAVLAELVEHVYTIEIVEPLADSAEKTLEQLDYENVTVKAGDGYQGWPEHAPFDAVIVTAAPDHIPQPLIDQLKEGGRMIIPVGKEGGIQQLRLLTKKEGEIEEESVMPVQFVPMTGESREPR
ncbi:MAG: protein-L-isoaspartate(D-aspartate) O-methyltransferase [Verrucomicrobiales bacterium]